MSEYPLLRELTLVVISASSDPSRKLATELLASYVSCDASSPEEAKFVNNTVVKIDVGELSVELCMIDASSDTGLAGVSTDLLERADAVMITFSLAKPADFAAIKGGMIEDLRKKASNAKVLVIGCDKNLRDGGSEGAVTTEEGRALISTEGGPHDYRECSPSTGDDVKAVFDRAVCLCVLQNSLVVKGLYSDWSALELGGTLAWDSRGITNDIFTSAIQRTGAFSKWNKFRGMAKHINMSHNNLTLVPDELQGLSALEELNLSHNNISHPSVDVLAALPAGCTIDLTNNPGLTAAAAGALVERLGERVKVDASLLAAPAAAEPKAAAEAAPAKDEGKKKKESKKGKKEAKKKGGKKAKEARADLAISLPDYSTFRVATDQEFKQRALNDLGVPVSPRASKEDGTESPLASADSTPASAATTAPATSPPPVSGDKVASWDVEACVAWLGTLGLPEDKLTEYSAVLRSNDVDGPVLLSLQEADLKELGIDSFGARRKVTMGLKELQAAASAD